MTMVPDAPSLDRAIASGTAFERPLPGSAAASSLGLSQSQQQRQPAGSTKTVKKGVKDLPTGYGAGAAAGPGLSFRRIIQPTVPRSSSGLLQSTPNIGAYPIAIAEPTQRSDSDGSIPFNAAAAAAPDGNVSASSSGPSAPAPATARGIKTFRPIVSSAAPASSSGGTSVESYTNVSPTIFTPDDQDVFLPSGGRIVVPTAITFPSARAARPRKGSERAALAERIGKRGLESSEGESESGGSTGRASDEERPAAGASRSDSGAGASGSGSPAFANGSGSGGGQQQPLPGSTNSRKKKRRKQREAERIAALVALTTANGLNPATEEVLDESERRRRSANDLMLSVPLLGQLDPSPDSKPALGASTTTTTTAAAASSDDDEIVEVDSTIMISKGPKVKLEETIKQIQRAIKGLPAVSPNAVEPPLTPAQPSSGATVVPPGSGALSTPSGTISAPISLATTGSTTSTSSASLRVPGSGRAAAATVGSKGQGGKLKASESGTSTTSGASRTASSIIASPQHVKQIVEVELSDDDDEDVKMKGTGATADGANESDADSVLEMDPITISSSSSSSDEQSDDEMDVSGESDGGSSARASKRRHKQRASSKPPVAASASAGKRKPLEYYQGKVEVVRSSRDLGVGSAKIMDLGASTYELRLSFKLPAAGTSSQQPQADIVCSKAHLEAAHFDEDKRTMSWWLNGSKCTARFLETSSWIQFIKAFGVTLKSATMPSPGRSPTARMTVGGGPPPSPSSAANKRPPTTSTVKPASNLFIAPQKRAPVGGSQTSSAAISSQPRKAQPVVASGRATIAADPPPALEPRKIKPPARYEVDEHLSEVDMSARPKKKVKTKPVAIAVLPPAAVVSAQTLKKAAERTRLEEIANSAVNTAKEPTAIRSRASQPTTEFTVDILQCNIGTGKIPQSAVGDLPKQVCVAIRAEMSPDEKYTEGKVMCLKESIYFPEVTFDPSGKKIMTFDPPLQFHMPAALFRTLPTSWPFRSDRGYRRGHFVRLRIEFLAFIDKDRRPSQWVLDEFGDYNQDDELVDFQCPYAQVPLIRPHRSGDLDRQVSNSNRAQLSIAGMELNPEFSFSFKFQAYWDAAAVANAPETAPVALRKQPKARPPPPVQATPNGERPTLAIQPPTVEGKQRKGKGRLILDEETDEDEEESCADALSSLNIASNGASADASDESRVHTPIERSVSPFAHDDDDEYDHDNARAKQAFTMVFEPKGPTFRPPPERSVPKGSQRIQPGTLAHDLANLDRDAVDNEIIEREELIFDIEGIHDGQKFVMALWNRWCSHVDLTLGRIHSFNAVSHVMGFINRYFLAMFQKNVRRYFVIHLQVLAAFDLCQNDTFAMALAQYSKLTQQVLKQSGALKAPGT